MMLIIIVCCVWVFRDDVTPQFVKAGTSEIAVDDRWGSIIASNVNSRGIKLQIDGKSVQTSGNNLFFDDDMNLYIA